MPTDVEVNGFTIFDSVVSSVGFSSSLITGVTLSSRASVAKSWYWISFCRALPKNETLINKTAITRT